MRKSSCGSGDLWCLVALMAFAASSGCAKGDMHLAGERDAHLVFDADYGDAATHTETGPIVFDVGTLDGNQTRDANTSDSSVVRTDCLATEDCGQYMRGNGLDDDCNGLVDETCACVEDQPGACFRGDARSRSVGACRDGLMQCTPGEFGRFMACEGDVLPKVEVCDAARVDEDCDGSSNEDCACVDGEQVECGSSQGICHLGKQTCVNGQFGNCEEQVGPAQESCNGLDDDCDGVIDQTCACIHNTTRACGRTRGTCQSGTEVCEAGHWSSCQGAVFESGETCNNLDDDCDGSIDEGLVRVCGSDVGACTSGVSRCVAGIYAACAGEVTPRTERCDGSIDEDCDGTVDEGCSCTQNQMRSCGNTQGICRAGMQVCDAQGSWGACTGQTTPQNELCNGLDDDCDGQTDEGCECIQNQMRACGLTQGVCRAGSQVCDLAGQWGLCTGQVQGSSEACNGLDDDCDGLIDENACVPPLAHCEADNHAYQTGTRINVVGSGEDPDGGAVTFQISFFQKPNGSNASLMQNTGTSSSFVPDLPGTYVLRFCVSDDDGRSACCDHNYAVTASCSPPSIPSIVGCGTSYDRRPIVRFDPMPSGLVYEFFAQGESEAYGSARTAGQNYFRPSMAISRGGSLSNPESLQIEARACRSDQPTCCSQRSSSLAVRMVEECATPVAPTSSNVIFSEYVVNGDGACPAATSCQAGEAIEITNLSNCPVALAGYHFSYCNGDCASSSVRYMNFTADDVIPPRGVYVAIRNRPFSMCAYDFFTGNDEQLFGLRISGLEMQGTNLASGWFNNGGGPMARLRIASGSFVNMTSGDTLAQVMRYATNAPSCGSVGFNAIDSCGELVTTPSTVLTSNQLGRLWHPCDAVRGPVPASCR